MGADDHCLMSSFVLMDVSFPMKQPGFLMMMLSSLSCDDDGLSSMMRKFEPLMWQSRCLL